MDTGEAGAAAMTTSISVLSVSADVAVLLVLAAAVAMPRMSSLARAVVATSAFACAWVVTAVFVAMRTPSWATLLGGAVIATSIVVTSATLHLWAREDDGGDRGPRQQGDHGGGGPWRRRPDPPHGGRGSEPSWWPEFEHQLAGYVAGREREKRPQRSHR